MSRPERTCVGCRKRAPKGDLVRLVWRGTLVVDGPQAEPGRGAYLHPGKGCLDAAVRRRAFGRALRLRNQNLGQIDTAGLTATFT